MNKIGYYSNRHMSWATPRLVKYYSDKVNVYDHEMFYAIPATPSPAPPPTVLIHRTTTLGTPYPTPYYHPVYPTCYGCKSAVPAPITYPPPPIGAPPPPLFQPGCPPLEGYLPMPPYPQPLYYKPF